MKGFATILNTLAENEINFLISALVLQPTENSKTGRLYIYFTTSNFQRYEEEKKQYLCCRSMNLRTNSDPNYPDSNTKLKFLVNMFKNLTINLGQIFIKDLKTYL